MPTRPGVNGTRLNGRARPNGRSRPRGIPRPGRAVPPGTANATLPAVTPNPSAINGSSRSGAFKVPDEIVEELDLTRKKRQARRRFRNYENYDVS